MLAIRSDAAIPINRKSEGRSLNLVNSIYRYEKSFIVLKRIKAIETK